MSVGSKYNRDDKENGKCLRSCLKGRISRGWHESQGMGMEGLRKSMSFVYRFLECNLIFPF